MSNLARLAIAASLVAGFGGVAQAQPHSHRAPAAAERYLALSEGRSAAIDRAAPVVGTVPPSESQTVMGLSVPH